MDIKFLALAVFLLISLFCSGSETALFSLTPIKLENLKKKHPSRGGLIQTLLSAPQKLLITILICNIFANILATINATKILEQYTSFDKKTISFLTLIIMTPLILVIGEVTPKTLAIKFAPSISLIIAPVFVVLMRLLTPLIFVFKKISKLLVGINSVLFYKNVSESDEYLSEELIEIVKDSKAQGVLNETESSIIENIIEFSDLDTWKLMRQRNEIFSFSIETPILDVIEKIKEKRYSRIPVWEETEENVIGILYVKDLLNITDMETTLSYYRKELKKPVFVPESMKAEDLLKFFQTTNTHLSLVIDEYGGISGLITLEDILEGIIGEVVDKDDIRPLFHKYNPYMIEVESKLDIDELNKVFNTNLKCDQANSVGGYLLEHIKSIPSTGDTYVIDGLQFKIEESAPHKIETILITKVRKIKKKKNNFLLFKD